MCITRSVWIPLIVLAAIVPLVVAARLVPPREEALSSPAGADVFLATVAVRVTDEPGAFKQLVTVPDGARWARIKNVNAAVVYLAAGSAGTASTSWPIGSGEEISFSLATDVYLMTAAGTLSVPALIGR